MSHNLSDIQDGESFEHAGTCNYRIWCNSLGRYGRRAIGLKEEVDE